MHNPPEQLLRAINPSDTFPCCLCFDSYPQRLNCLQCNGQGYLPGNHPMVMFVDDCISKNFGKLVEGHLGDMGDLGDMESDSVAVRRNYGQSEIFMDVKQMQRQGSRSEVYIDRRSLGGEQKFGLFKSLRPGQSYRGSHQGHICDNCKTKPIEGTRYHCKKCQDYDLCEKCYVEGMFEGSQHRVQHEMEKIQNDLSKKIEMIKRKFAKGGK